MRAPSADGTTCQVIPVEGESPCTRNAKNRGGHKPRLCAARQKEYIRYTIAYKSSSEQAEAFCEDLQRLIDDLDWTRPLMIQVKVDEAFRAVHRCIAALDRKIREREAHNQRFFTQMNYRHERWRMRLLDKRERVKQINGLLCCLKLMLLKDQRSRAPAPMAPSPAPTSIWGRDDEGGDGNYCADNSYADDYTRVLFLETVYGDAAGCMLRAIAARFQMWKFIARSSWTQAFTPTLLKFLRESVLYIFSA